MAVTVKSIELWRTEVENRPGTLTSVLAPLAEAGADLQLVMGYRYPGNEAKAAIEVFPVKGKKAATAAGTAGLERAAIPALLIEADNRVGLGHTISKALADAGINLDFLMAQVVGRKCTAVAGFANAEDARKATALIRKATAKK